MTRKLAAAVASALLAAASLSYWYWISTFGIRWAFVALGCVFAAGVFARHLWCGGKIDVSDADVAGSAFIAWVALSLLWSTDPRGGAISLMHLVALGGVFLLVEHVSRETLAVIPAAVTATYAGALVLVFAETELYGGFANPNWATEWLLIAAPFVVVFKCKRFLKHWAWLLVAVAAVYLLWFNNSKAEFIALWLCIAAFLALRRMWAGALITLILPLSLAAMWPQLATPAVRFSVLSRLEIWANTVLLWAERPLTGHGLGSYDVEYPRVQEVHLAWFPDATTIFQNSTIYVGAAHNEVLQIMAELGLVGLVLASGFLWTVLRPMKAGSTSLKNIYVASTTSLLITASLSLFSFPLQNPQTALLAAVALGIVANAKAHSRAASGYLNPRDVWRQRLDRLRAVVVRDDNYLGER